MLKRVYNRVWAAMMLTALVMLCISGQWGLALLTLCLAGPVASKLGVAGQALTWAGGLAMDTTTAPATGTAIWQMLPQYMAGMSSTEEKRSFLLNRLRQKAAIPLVGGTHFELALRSKGVISSAWNGSSGAFARGGYTTGFRPKANPANMYMTLQFDENTIKRARSNEVVFQDAFYMEMERNEEDNAKLKNQSLYLPSTGYLGRVAGSPSSGVITLDNDGLVNTLAGDLTKYLPVGLPVASIAGGSIVQNGLLIKANDPTAGTVTTTAAGTLDGAAGHGSVADNDYLVIGHLDSVRSCYNQAPTGLVDWLGATTGTIWEINRATYPEFAPMRTTQTQGETLEACLRRARSKAWKYGGGQNMRFDPNEIEDFIWLTCVEGYNLYGSQFAGQRQFVVETNVNAGITGTGVALRGGFTGLWADGVIMLPDVDCPAGHFYGLHLAQDWDLYGDSYNSPIPLGGGALFGILEHIPTFPLYIGTLGSSFQLGCRMPNRNVDVHTVTMTVL
jgi:hypothetical protein